MDQVQVQVCNLKCGPTKTRKSIFCSRKGRRDSWSLIEMHFHRKRSSPAAAAAATATATATAAAAAAPVHERALQTMWVQVDSMKRIHFP